MSDAHGQVRFEDGTIMHYFYDANSDTANPKLWNNAPWAWWRTRPGAACTCGNDESVSIASDYGFGSWWLGKACKNCEAITDGLEPKNSHDGHPDWWLSQEEDV